MSTALVVIDLHDPYASIGPVGNLPERVATHIEQSEFSDIYFIGCKPFKNESIPVVLRQYVDPAKLFIKDELSAFDNPLFEASLRAQAHDDIHYVGISTGACVLATVTHSHDKGFPTSVVTDLCRSSMNMERHQYGLECLAELLPPERLLVSGL